MITAGPQEAQMGALNRLVHDLDNLGLPDQLSATRTQLARARQLGNDLTAAAGELRDEFGLLVCDVADGTTSAVDALRVLTTYAPTHITLDTPYGSMLGRFSEQVTRTVDDRVLKACRAEAADTHAALAARAAQAVREAVEAAGHLIDLDQWVRDMQAAARAGWREGEGLPGFPTLDPSGLRSRLLGHWGTCQEAHDTFLQVHETAGQLRQIAPHLSAGKGSVRFRKPAGRDERELLSLVTEPLQLAVAATLGWEPGLWLPAESSPEPTAGYVPDNHRNRQSHRFAPDAAASTSRLRRAAHVLRGN